LGKFKHPSAAANEVLIACSQTSSGTTNSAVAIMEGPTAKIIENSEGMQILYLFDNFAP